MLEHVKGRDDLDGKDHPTHRAAECANHAHGTRGHKELVSPDVLPMEGSAAMRGARDQLVRHSAGEMYQRAFLAD